MFSKASPTQIQTILSDQPMSVLTSTTKKEKVTTVSMFTNPDEHKYLIFIELAD